MKTIRLVWLGFLIVLLFAQPLAFADDKVEEATSPAKVEEEQQVLDEKPLCEKYDKKINKLIKKIKDRTEKLKKLDNNDAKLGNWYSDLLQEKKKFEEELRKIEEEYNKCQTKQNGD